MGISRDLSFPTHTVVELMLGVFTIIAGAALGATDIGIVAGVVFGATMMGLAMSGIGVVHRRDDRPPMSIELHHAADQFLSVGLIASAILLGIAGDAIASAVLITAAAADLALEFKTRYVAGE